MMGDLIELAELCEAATGPDRELDLLVKAAVFGGEARVSPYNGEWCLYDGTDRAGRARVKERPRALSHEAWMADRYTASIDAAMQLAPEGCIVTIGSGLGIGTAVIAAENGETDSGSKAATPALALTAAALRARASQEGTGGSVEGEG